MSIWVYILESPSPKDLVGGRYTVTGLESLCRIYGYKSSAFRVLSRAEFESRLKFIAQTETSNDDWICVHLDCHGDENGIQMGSDYVSTDNIVEALKPILQRDDLRGKFILIISACFARALELPFSLRIDRSLSQLDRSEPRLSLPEYIFFYDDDLVKYRDAVLSCAILYRSLDRGVTSFLPTSIYDTLKRMARARLGNMICHRWDGKANRYRQLYPPLVLGRKVPKHLRNGKV